MLEYRERNRNKHIISDNEYESEQTFTEHDDGSFEMITGNTIEEVTEWLRQKIN